MWGSGSFRQMSEKEMRWLVPAQNAHKGLKGIASFKNLGVIMFFTADQRYGASNVAAACHDGTNMANTPIANGNWRDLLPSQVMSAVANHGSVDAIGQNPLDQHIYFVFMQEIYSVEITFSGPPAHPRINRAEFKQRLRLEPTIFQNMQCDMTPPPKPPPPPPTEKVSSPIESFIILLIAFTSSS